MKRLCSVRAAVVALSIMWCCANRASVAAQQALSINSIGAKTSIRIDGDLREWRGVRFIRIGEARDAQLEYALGYDAQALYVGARVYDDEFVRSRRPSPAEDAVVLTLVMPRNSGKPESTALWLYAGVMGKQRAELARGSPGANPTPLAGASIAEGPLEGASGYVLEARVPWAAIPGSAELAVGRGAIALHDVDGKGGERAHEHASARAKPGGELPPLLVEAGANAAIASFLHAKELTPDSVRHDRVGDVAGDARLERVVVAGTFAVLAGPDIGAGNGYTFIDLPVPIATDVLDAVLRDQDGDGKAELLLWLRPEPTVPYAYRWDGAQLKLLPREPPPTVAAEPAARVTRSVAPAAPRVEHPAPPGAAELVAAFRQARGIDPSVKARFVQHVNVAEDARLESLMLFGKDLLVIGKGYRGGTGYFYFGLPVRDATEIARVFTADVTGDGRRELFVRVKQQIDDVQREILRCYRFDDGGMQEILAVEVRRTQGDSLVGNVVELVPDRGLFALAIAPGRARGWDARSYPFVAESSDAVAPILLPWQARTLRYRFDGARLVAGGTAER